MRYMNLSDILKSVRPISVLITNHICIYHACDGIFNVRKRDFRYPTDIIDCVGISVQLFGNLLVI
jgi:hypothetical protein